LIGIENLERMSAFSLNHPLPQWQLLVAFQIKVEKKKVEVNQIHKEDKVRLKIGKKGAVAMQGTKELVRRICPRPPRTHILFQKRNQVKKQDIDKFYEIHLINIF
jgi:hypothetical protein